MQRRGARGPSNSDAGVSGERGRRLVPPGAAPPLALGAATSWSPRCRTRRACQGLVPQERPHDPTGAGAFPANARLRRHPAVDVFALTRAALGGEAWIVEDVGGRVLVARHPARAATRDPSRCRGDVAWDVRRGRRLGSSAERHTGDSAAREALLLPRPSGSRTLHCLSCCLSSPTRQLTTSRQTKLRREACRRRFK